MVKGSITNIRSPQGDWKCSKVFCDLSQVGNYRIRRFTVRRLSHFYTCDDEIMMFASRNQYSLVKHIFCLGIMQCEKKFKVSRAFRTGSRESWFYNILWELIKHYEESTEEISIPLTPHALPEELLNDDLWFSSKRLISTVHNLLVRPIWLILKVGEMGTRFKYMQISGKRVELVRYWVSCFINDLS